MQIAPGMGWDHVCVHVIVPLTYIENPITISFNSCRIMHVIGIILSLKWPFPLNLQPQLR